LIRRIVYRPKEYRRDFDKKTREGGHGHWFAIATANDGTVSGRSASGMAG